MRNENPRKTEEPYNMGSCKRTLAVYSLLNWGTDWTYDFGAIVLATRRGVQVFLGRHIAPRSRGRNWVFSLLPHGKKSQGRIGFQENGAKPRSKVLPCRRSACNCCRVHHCGVENANQRTVRRSLAETACVLVGSCNCHFDREVQILQVDSSLSIIPRCSVVPISKRSYQPKRAGAPFSANEVL